VIAGPLSPPLRAPSRVSAAAHPSAEPASRCGTDSTSRPALAGSSFQRIPIDPQESERKAALQSTTPLDRTSLCASSTIITAKPLGHRELYN